MMPTFERMKVSPRGQKTIWMIQHFRYLVLFLHFLFTTLVPQSLFSTVIGWIKSESESRFIRLGLDSLYRTRCLCNVLFMANDELKTVKDLDPQLIRGDQMLNFQSAFKN